MKMMLSSAVCLILCVSCGRQGSRYELGREYVRAFELASQEVGRPLVVNHLIIEFGETGSAAAKCEWGGLGSPQITVKRSAWDFAGPIEREIILFHEMGHCLLDRDHLNALRQDGTPRSLMNAHAVSVRAYQNMRNYYLQELFGTR